MNTRAYLTPEILLKGLFFSNNTADVKITILSTYISEGLLTDTEIKETIYSDKNLPKMLDDQDDKLITYIYDIVAPILDEKTACFILKEYNNRYHPSSIFSNTFIEAVINILPPSEYAISKIPLRFFVLILNDASIMNEYLSFIEIQDLLPFAYDSFKDSLRDNIVHHIISRESELFELDSKCIAKIASHYMQLSNIKKENICQLSDQYTDMILKCISYYFSLSNKNWLFMTDVCSKYPHIYRELLDIHETYHDKIIFGESIDSIRVFLNMSMSFDATSHIHGRIADNFHVFVGKSFRLFLYRRDISANHRSTLIHIISIPFDTDLTDDHINHIYEILDMYRNESTVNND